MIHKYFAAFQVTQKTYFSLKFKRQPAGHRIGKKDKKNDHQPKYNGLLKKQRGTPSIFRLRNFFIFQQLKSTTKSINDQRS